MEFRQQELRRQDGFSLIEIMVGLVIGMLATLVIMQVFSVFEAQKRTTTGSSDAQTNGSIALFTIKRDIEMAGYGLPVFSTINSPLLCDPVPKVDHDGDPATAQIDISPVVIIDGANGGSDTISVRYSTADQGDDPLVVDKASDTAGIPRTIDLKISNDEADVTNNLGCRKDEPNKRNFAIVSNGAVCGIARVKAITGTTNITLDTTTLPAGWDTTLYIKGASLACMGTWNEYQYKVNNGRLEVNGAPAMADVVNIQAQYGISATTSSNQVVQWVDPVGATWANPTPANRNLIKAIRVAVVARNGQLEKTDVTASCTSTTAANPTGLCAWDATSAAPINASPAPVIDLTADPDWRRYRYRVYETIVPLRSVIWSRNVL